MKRLYAIIAAFVLCSAGAFAQNYDKFGMQYVVVQGDTIFVDTLPPARVSARWKKKKGTEWRRYYKLVYNFNKVYPYALVGRKLMAQVDSTIEASSWTKSEKNSYVNQVERELLRLFEQDIRDMTISQGYVLIRLVDRECGMSPYEIIETYEGTFSAKFWQLVAKIFSHDLKTKYNPKGNDNDSRIEELVGIWDGGNWDNFYYSVFYDYPTKTVITTDRLSDPRRQK